LPRLEFGLPVLFRFQDIFVRGRRPSHFQKKELVGDFKNAGRGWKLKASRKRLVFTTLKSRSRSKARWLRMGCYDLGRNMGWVSVGVDRDTA
jgi:hypothetical protein